VFSQAGRSENNFYIKDIEAVPNKNDLIQALKGDKRIFFIVPKKSFPQVDFEFRKISDNQHIKVLDDRSYRYILITNKLGDCTHYNIWRNAIMAPLNGQGPFFCEEDRNWIASHTLTTEADIPEDNFHPGYALYSEENPKRGQPGEQPYIPVLEFIGYRIEDEIIGRNGKLHLWMYFKVVREMQTSYKIFMHIDQPGSTDRIHSDHWPLNMSKDPEEENCIGCYKSTYWIKGDIIVDEYERTIPIGSYPGTYEMWVGFFNTGNDKRLKITKVDKGVVHRGDDRALIGQFSVRQF
jgi:hypothetical protein